MNWKKIGTMGALLLVCAFLFSFATSQAATVTVPLRETVPIQLKAVAFTPGINDVTSIPEGLVAEPLVGSESGYYIVQFRGPVQADWKVALETVGAIVGDYIPNYAVKVRMSAATAESVADLGAVNWIGRYQPAYKISPQLQQDGLGLYRILVDRSGSVENTAVALAQNGATVLRQNDRFIVVGAHSDSINNMVRIEDVAWIENFTLHETHNEYGAGAIIGSAAANANGFDGSTQVIAIADTGLGGGTPTTAHPDVPASRITNIFNLTGPSDSCVNVVDDGAVDVDSGHGTHVTLSAVSDGDGTGVGRGAAPAANLVFQAVEDYGDFQGFCAFFYTDGYYLLSLPSDIYNLFAQAYSAGARIHSNSWGSSVAGDYTADSARADAFIWDNPDMTITFSAGNSGTDANGNGVVDNDSIGSPATAKNVITVGASENQRSDNFPCDPGLGYTDCAAQGGVNNIFAWGDAWPSDFPAEPLASDASAGDAQQMAAFSSRGPTDDGRIKPDIVAPGSWILSGYSNLYQQGYDGSPNPVTGNWQYDGYGFPYSEQYKYLSGTSMSNPIAAGGAALVRDYYQKTDGHGASAALVKATLINSAVDMLDENNDGADDNDFPIPNVHEGWGLINLAGATDGSHQYVDNTAGLATGGSDSYTFNVSSGSAFKVTLVWSDYPSTEAAAVNLVNDLDLQLTAPNGDVYLGNVFSGGWSVTGSSRDTTNNVENVYIQSPADGTWTVQVNAFNVPNGPQPFALVVDGNLGGVAPTNTPPPPPPTATNTPEPTATNTPEPTATNTPEPTATNTPVLPTATNTPEPTATNTPVLPTATNTPGPTPTNTPEPTATNTPEPTATNTPAPTATNTPEPTSTPVGATTMHIADLDDISTSINNRWWNATVRMLVVDDAGAPVNNATVTITGSYGASSSTGTCTTNSSGLCTMSGTTRAPYLIVTVDNISHSTLTYNSAANTDPDGDSDGTTITLYRP